jgi:hypothetical protein
MSKAALGAPELLQAQFEGRKELDTHEAIWLAYSWINDVCRGLYRVAAEIDKLRADAD